MFYNRPTREYMQVRNQYGRNYGYTPFGGTRRPWSHLETIPTTYLPLNQQWNQQYGQQFGFGPSSMHCAAPCTDVLELDDQYVLEIALPGVCLDDVELKVEENLLTVIAKRTPNMFEERATWLRQELNCGLFVRHFEFDCPIINEHIEARMDRGILFVSIPKVEAALRIPVSAGNIESHISGRTTRVTGKNEVLRSGKQEVSVK